MNSPRTTKEQVIDFAGDEPEERWQPIETAPKDGTRILAFDPECGTEICYPKMFPRPVDGYSESWPRDKWEIFRDDKYAPGHTWSFYPTHWMPLPPPPKVTP